MNSEYTTSDLALASAISLWVPIDSIDRSNPRHATFIFKRTDDLDGIIELYWKGQLPVDAQTYYLQIKAVKTRLYGEGSP